jgi:hypothetical protein
MLKGKLWDGCEGEADAADDEIRWHLMGTESEQLHRVVELDWPEDEPIALKLGEPELQCVTDTYGKDRWLRWLIGDGRIVVAIDDRDAVRW